MSRNAKIAAVAALAGVMMAVAVVSLREASHAPPPARTVRDSRERGPLAAELARCRTLTMPDRSCDAAGGAATRRFLGEEREAVDGRP